MKYYQCFRPDGGLFYGYAVISDDEMYTYLQDGDKLFIKHADMRELAFDIDYVGIEEHPTSGLEGVFAELVKDPKPGGYLSDGTRMSDAEYFKIDAWGIDEDGDVFFADAEEYGGVRVPELEPNVLVATYRFPDGSHICVVAEPSGGYSAIVV